MPSREPIDLLIDARWIVPVEPERTVLEHHALVIDAGRIVASLPAAEAAARYRARSRVSLPQHALLPGLVNLHSHAATCLLAGATDEAAAVAAIEARSAAAEHRHLSARFVKDGTWLAGVDMLRGGITCFNDIYFHPEAAAEAALSLGMRAALGIMVSDAPSAYAADADDYLAKGLAARDRLRDEALISFCMAPQSPDALSEHNLERILTLANQLDLPIHLHLHESRAQIDASVRRFGLRPLARLQRLGLLGPNLIAAQAVHLEAEEIAALGEQGCSVAHCPIANLQSGSGVAPVVALRRQGVRIGLGSDGGAQGLRLDLFAAMRQAALLARLASAGAEALSAHELLRMATLDGAAALGLDQRIGSLLPGKEADLCAVRLDSELLARARDPVTALVFATERERVSHVWIAGQERVSDGVCRGIDAAGLLDLASSWHNISTS